MSQLGDISKAGVQKKKVDDEVVDSDNKQVSPKPLIVDFTSTLTGYKCPMCFENVIVIDELDVIVKTLMEHVQTEVGDPKNIEIWIDGDHMTIGQKEVYEPDISNVVKRTAAIKMEAETVELNGVLGEIPLPHLPNQTVLPNERNLPLVRNYDILKNCKRVHTLYIFLNDEEIQVNYDIATEPFLDEFDVETPTELDVRSYLDLAHYIKIGFDDELSPLAQRSAEFKDILSRSRARTIVIWCLDAMCTTDCLAFLPNGKTWGWQTDTMALREGLHLLGNFSHIANIDDDVSLPLFDRIVDHRNVSELFIQYGPMFNYDKYLREWASNLRTIIVWKINIHGQTNVAGDERIVRRRSRDGCIERLKFYCRVGPELTEIRMFLLGVYSPDNEEYEMPNSVFNKCVEENFDPDNQFSIA